MVQARIEDLVANIEKLDNKKMTEVLMEMYSIVDEYNQFVKYMDKRFDVVVSGLEQKADE